MIALCLAGSQEAWTALVERYSALVWTIPRSHRLDKDDCEEVFQQTWLKVHQSLHRLHTPERFSAWLTTCARRESLRQYERARRYIPVEDAAALEHSTAVPCHPGPEEALLAEEDRVRVRTALARLSPRDKALLTLLSADQAPGYDEISRLLNIARGSVGPLRSRALHRLANHLHALDRPRPAA
ncbi:RNA polymerase sigma factor [Streptomyces sp. CA-181903]|uniref:RNA polymerase sigma factor n=1 Tax=Streptomyces sp. CA-181903 TaxID=3240055 RepID=UPI003D94A1CD